LRGDIFSASGGATGDGGNDTIIGCERTTGDNLSGDLSAGDGGNDVIRGCSRCTADNNSFSIQTS